MSSDNPAHAPSGGLFSSLSLGARRTPRTSSDMIAHPLLGTSVSSVANETSSTTIDDKTTAASQDANSNRTPGLVRVTSTSSSMLGTSPGSASGALPYKPRQRTVPAPVSPPRHAPAPHVSSPVVVTAPTASTSTSTTFALPSAPDGVHLDATATSRLQLQSLKAAAQRIGLGNGSMGMGMIDSIFDKAARANARGESGDWGDLLKVLTSGKAIILLPSSPASSLPMTPQTLRDHVAFLSPPISVTSGTSTPSGQAAVLVTLSGLVGTLRGTTLAFESSLPSDTALIPALRDDVQRVAALTRLRPTQPASAAASFPNYTLSPESAPLPFPGLGKAVPIAVPDKPAMKEAPRRINPFASLFGTPTVSTPVSSPSLGGTRSLSPDPLASGRPTSPAPVSQGVSPRSPSVLSLERDSTVSPDPAEGYTVVAYTINKPVRYNEVHKALVKAVRSTLRSDLDGLPEKVVDKTLKLVVGSVCPVSGLNADQALLKSHHHVMGNNNSSSNNTTIPLDFSDPAATGERLQDFMEAIYDDLMTHYRTADSPRKPWSRAGSLDPNAEDDDESKKAADKEHEVEQAASEGTERIEAQVCRLLYNRIFSPLQSDDGRHDEALASRIAALNMLDLSLDHLGLITRPEGEKPRGVVAKGLSQLCGDIGLELQKLSAPDCLTPKDKTDVLVQAHKIAVDGLEDLPPIELRPEGEPYVAPPPDEDQEMESMEDEEEKAEDKEEEGGETDSPGVITEEPEPQQKRSTSGADLILPLMIYAVVKANPPQLASQLMYLRRYRSAICLVGEASYAIVNLTAVVEFLEHVHLSELGLGDSDRVMSVEDLTPIGLPFLDDGTDAASIASASSRLRGRVFQVSELAGSAAGSANKVITGVVDSSWSALRGIINSSSGTPQVTASPPDEALSPASPALALPVPRPGGRPRQSSTFSLASVTASVANIAAAASTAAARTRSRASSHADWPNQEMVEVAPRPESLRGDRDRDIYAAESDAETEHGDDDEDTAKFDKDKESIGGRLAQQFGRLTPAPEVAGTSVEKPGLFATLTRAPRRHATANAAVNVPSISTSTATAVTLREEPLERFMTCETGDLRVSEVGALLRDYRRLAGVVARLQERERERERDGQ